MTAHLLLTKYLRQEAGYDRLLRPYRERADRIMVFTNVFMCCVCLLVAPYRNTWGTALGFGLPTLLLAWWLKTVYAGALMTRLYMGLAFMAYTALLIHQTGGDIEAHFSAFGLIGALLYYRDWRTIAAATIYIYLHHLIAGYAQYIGYSIYVFDNANFWSTFIIHVAYFLPFIGMMMYLSIWLRREGVEQQMLINQDQLIKTRLEVAKDAAEIANRYKNEFLANISHEIRTPLNGVLGMIQILLTSQLSEQQRHQLGMAHKSTEQLLGIINDVLDYSKIESGKLQIHPEPCNIHELNQQIIEIFRLMASSVSKPVNLVAHMDSKLPQWLILDGFRVRQILNNLVGNAFKFTEQGEILVAWAFLAPASDTHPPMLQITVSDTGIGFDETIKEQLFKPFVQGDGSITRKYGGTGLGLSICSELVKRMGGSLSATSEPGKGTVFICELPYAHCSPPAPESIRPLQPIEDFPSARSSLNILLVEDDAINQQVIELMLKKIGHRVMVAADGQQGLDLYHSHSFDLILMDLMMPRMGGLEALRVIRHQESQLARTRTPVFILSANAQIGNEAKYHRAGADAYLTKPIQVKALHNAIEALKIRQTPGT